LVSAIAAQKGGAVLRFALAAGFSMVGYNGSQISIGDGLSVTIVGVGVGGGRGDGAQLDAKGAGRHFDVNTKGALAIEGLTLRNGATDFYGGAIICIVETGGNLTATNCVFSKNHGVSK
jgi:hypothetical protein